MAATFLVGIGLLVAVLALYSGFISCFNRSTDPVSFRAPGQRGLADGRRTPACVSGLTKTEAEQLLDWLEANGYAHWELSLDQDHYRVCY